MQEKQEIVQQQLLLLLRIDPKQLHPLYNKWFNSRILQIYNSIHHIVIYGPLIQKEGTST